MLTILGPTACGKTALAAQVAHEVNAEIISADSRQVYRGMDIGTGKDLNEYLVSGKPVPYHLINIIDAGSKYNLYQYQKDFLTAYNSIVSRKNLPILCGGTGLYIEAVLHGYNLSEVPQNQELRQQLEGKSLTELAGMLKALKAKTGSHMHNKTDIDSCQRAIRAIEIELYTLEHHAAQRKMPAIASTIVGIDINRNTRRERISHRLKQRLENGMIEEVQTLLDAGIAPADLIYYGLEYKYVTEFVIGALTYTQMLEQLEIAIHQFAKRQMTWFRGMERRGFNIHWIDYEMPAKDKIKYIKDLL